jgi:hypothetical protein
MRSLTQYFYFSSRKRGLSLIRSASGGNGYGNTRGYGTIAVWHHFNWDDL